MRSSSKKRPTTEHYVDNKEFLIHMIEFKDAIKEAELIGNEKPRIPDKIGKVFMQIAVHLSYKSNFINYGFREDMISDGIENCIQYIHNFDPDKSRNPFAYFTQIIYYAKKKRISMLNISRWRIHKLWMTLWSVNRGTILAFPLQDLPSYMTT